MDDKTFAERFRERLTLYARTYYNKGQTNFEFFVGISSGSISNSRKNGMSALNLARIAERCPQLNLRWLLLGEGEMTEELGQAKAASVATVGDISADNQSPVTVSGNGGDAKAIEALAEECRGLRQQLAAQTEIIRALAKARK